jgi:hypothetical protein
VMKTFCKLVLPLHFHFHQIFQAFGV